MFFTCERDSSEGVSSEFDTSQLDEDGEDEDDEEEGVVEEVLENVDFRRLQLTGIDLVEDLHQDETVEEDAVVLSAINSPLLNADRRLDAQKFGTYINQAVPLKRTVPSTKIWRRPWVMMFFHMSGVIRFSKRE